MPALKKSRVSNKSKKNIKNHKRLSLKKQRGGARIGDTVYSIPDNTEIGQITNILQSGTRVRYILGNVLHCDKPCCHVADNGSYHVKSVEKGILWATEQRLVLNPVNNIQPMIPTTDQLNNVPPEYSPPVMLPEYSPHSMQSTTKESIKATILNLLNNQQTTKKHKLLGIKLYLESLH